MKFDYVIAEYDDQRNALYQLEIKELNGKPLRIGPKIRLIDNDAVKHMIKMGDQIARLEEPVYPRAVNPQYQAVLNADMEAYWAIRGLAAQQWYRA